MDRQADRKTDSYGPGAARAGSSAPRIEVSSGRGGRASESRISESRSSESHSSESRSSESCAGVRMH